MDKELTSSNNEYDENIINMLRIIANDDNAR